MEPMAIWGVGTREERRAKASQTLESVGINPKDAGGRRPIEFSGGQCQRISIARALMLEPTLLICDEPVSALDVSVQAQILNLLDDLKRERGLTMVFIAHDLAVVKNVSDRVAVMYLGKLCEVSPPDILYRHPAHPYTAALLASIPEPDPAAAGNGTSPLAGELPSPANPRRVAASAPAAPTPRTSAPRRSRRCGPSVPTTSWPVTSRWPVRPTHPRRPTPPPLWSLAHPDRESPVTGAVPLHPLPPRGRSFVACSAGRACAQGLRCQRQGVR